MTKAEYQRKYREKNREKLNAKALEYVNRKYREDDEYRKKRKAYQLEYRKRNLEKIQKQFKKYREENKDKLLAYAREYNKSYKMTDKCKKTRSDYYQKTKERCKKRSFINHLKRNFSITVQKYNEMLESQKDECAICGIHFNEYKYQPCVDHCHKTGEIRGLLCRKCNLRLATIEDTIFCKKAHQYLLKIKK